MPGHIVNFIQCLTLLVGLLDSTVKYLNKLTWPRAETKKTNFTRPPVATNLNSVVISFERTSLCRIFKFLDHVKEGVDIGRDYNVSKWADIMILACDSNRFNRVQQILPRWKGSKNPKITISCYRRVPGLGTALTKTAMKDVEEKGVKVKIIFNILLRYFPLSLNFIIISLCMCEMVCICVSGNVCGLVSRHRRQCLFACKVIMV